MQKLHVRAPAKVNLFLRVVGTRADGYHLIDSLMVPVGVWDEVEIEAGGVGSGGSSSAAIRVECDDPSVPSGEANLAHRAAALFLRETGASTEVRIRIAKRVPVGSGLGGGSSDGAAVLKGLNRLLGSGLSARRLAAMGARLGADVPFFVACRPARVGGVGEVVTPVDGVRSLWLVIVVPWFSVSTAWAYGRFDEVASPAADTGTRIEPFLSGAWPLHDLLVNDLERVVASRHPEIEGLKRALLGCGAGGAVMSGSGSAVFGVFRTRGEAQRAVQAHSGQRAVFVVKTLTEGGGEA